MGSSIGSIESTTAVFGGNGSGTSSERLSVGGSFGSGSKETIESSKGSAVDTNIGRHTTGSSKDQPKTEKKGSSWWNPFSWGKMDGGKVMGRIPPRLTNKQYFFGKIFKGISKVVSGVVKGVSNVVSSIA